MEQDNQSKQTPQPEKKETPKQLMDGIDRMKKENAYFRAVEAIRDDANYKLKKIECLRAIADVLVAISTDIRAIKTHMTELAQKSQDTEIDKELEKMQEQQDEY
jgi:hypothetical protein